MRLAKGEKELSVLLSTIIVVPLQFENIKAGKKNENQFT